MKVTKNLNALSEIEFLSIFGSIFEKSEWIASKTYQLKPFNDQEDLIHKMMKIYNNCSKEKIVEILNLHPKLAIEKKLTKFSLKPSSKLLVPIVKSLKHGVGDGLIDMFHMT